ncbi:hypothetical protein DFH08DRAFT_899661 [Mycena albidolilacea]|uniref:Uncharacterized protein n=1 Tax=Mycena albidolilacea TaxID=1033008 RepID=A0AAD7EBD6_9AGAR|nr:hypothetical protein DFH08DRAFT_899661 [Mycena albidolilacea]
MLSYSKSALVGAILEDLAYGLYFSYFLQGLHTIFGRKKRGNFPIRLLITSLILFFLITLRMVLDNKFVVTAFTYDPITPYAADIYMQGFGNGAMFRTGTYVALTIVADIFIVYRVYAIWSGSIFAAAVPSVLAIADIVTGGLFIQAIRELAAGDSPDGKNVATHAIVFYSFTLALNVISSFLISLRIYITKRQVEDIAGGTSLLDLTTTMTILIESAVLYSAALIAMIVPTALGDNVQFCLLSVMPSIIGIAFSLIIVRIGAGLSPASSTGPNSTLQFARSAPTTATSQFDTTDASTSGHDSMIQVHLSPGSQRSREMSSISERATTNGGDKENV